MTTPPTDTRTHSLTYVPIQSHWVWPVRVIWALLTISSIWLFVSTVPLQVEAISTVCYERPCTGPQQLAAENLPALESLELPLRTYALIHVGRDVLFVFILVTSGIIMFWQQPDDWMALLFSIVSIAAGTGMTPMMQVNLSNPSSPLHLPASILVTLGTTLFIIPFFTAPDGRFVPRWTIWLAGIWSIISLLAPLTATLFTPVWFTLIFIITGFGLSFQIYRYRHVSTPTQRQQTKWILFGFGMLFLGVLIMFIPQVLFPSAFHLGERIPLTPAQLIYVIASPYLALIAIAIFPISVIMSTLRLGLWNVDPLINRSLVYLGLASVLGIAFGGGYFLIQITLSALLGSDQSTIAAAIAGGVVVGLYNPTHTRLRRFVDRRLYGIELDYVQAIKNYNAHHTLASIRSSNQTTFGDYTDLQLLGRGGMGEVYLGKHPTLGRNVAIKMLAGQPDHTSKAYKRFLREAQTIARLKHPNIIVLHDVGEEGGIPYMVMEHIGGDDLGQLIKNRGKLPLPEALPLLNDIAAALDYAHEQGIIHRDIKPSNVMIEAITSTNLQRTHRAVLMDFGIAHITTTNTQLTGDGMIGTVDYIAPEQIQGASQIDSRADIYALGIMTYQMLTGEVPFKNNNTYATLIAHTMRPPPDPRDVLPDLPKPAAKAIMKAMAKKPEDRFATASELVTALAPSL